MAPVSPMSNPIILQPTNPNDRCQTRIICRYWFVLPRFLPVLRTSSRGKCMHNTLHQRSSLSDSHPAFPHRFYPLCCHQHTSHHRTNPAPFPPQQTPPHPPAEPAPPAAAAAPPPAAPISAPAAPRPAAALAGDAADEAASAAARAEGNALFGRGDFRGAAERFTEAHHLRPDDHLPLANRSRPARESWRRGGLDWDS